MAVLLRMALRVVLRVVDTRRLEVEWVVKTSSWHWKDSLR
jgi:hypothetical protein